MNKKSIIVIISLFCITANTANAQEKWQFRLSYGQVYNAPQEHAASHFRIDVGREVIHQLYAGVYVGYSKLQSPFLTDILIDEEGNENYQIYRQPTNAIFYGLNLRYQMLPLLTGRENLRFELYPVAKIGFVSDSWETFVYDDEFDLFDPLFRFEKVRHSRTNFEFGLGLGAAYNFTRKFGVFGEATFGQFVDDQNFRFHLGVKFNF